MAREENNIIYLEPNDFSVSGYDNIPFRTEDYCISIDLQVEKGSRSQCGEVSTNSKVYRMEWRETDGNLSFLSGTKLNGSNINMLTTSYLDTSFNDIQSEKENLEGLGIESIDIGFDSWFFPRVTIRFVDVRGISVMMPEDYAHIKKGESHPGSFFKSFFTFPYPKFTLEVKGFYGGKTSFLLAIDDFRTAFNADTGNFEMTVSFIGYMYGLLTDISMKQLIAAPYDEYEGAKYWENKGFTFENGAKIPTIIDFLSKITVSNKEFEKMASENDTMKQFSSIQNELNALSEIKEAYENFYESLGSSEGRLIGDNQLLITTSNKVLNYDSKLKERLITLLNEYNDNVEYNNRFDPYPNDENTFVSNSIFSYYDAVELFEIDENNIIKKGSKNPNTIDRIQYDLLLDENGWGKLIKDDVKLLTLINNNVNVPAGSSLIKGCYAYLYKDNGFRNLITTRINRKNIELQTLMNKIDEFQKQASEGIFGFEPSIGNITKMIFAHFETFLNSIYRCTGNIKSEELQEKRSLKHLLIQSSQSDLKGNSNENAFVPPFPEYTKNENGKREWAWIGDREGGGRMEEINLINGFLNGLAVTEKEYDDIITAILNENEEIDSSLNFFPLLNSDLLSNKNPYTSIFSNKDLTLKVDELMSHFALRAIHYLGTTREDEKYLSTYGKLEALNFFKSHPTLDSKTLSILENKNIEKSFLDYLRNTDKEKIPFHKNGKEMGASMLLHDSKSMFLKNQLTEGDKYNWVKYPGTEIDILPVNFDYIKGININTTPFYSRYDVEKTNTYKNPYVFEVYDDCSRFEDILNGIQNSSDIEKSDKEKITRGWKLDFDNYHNYYGDDTFFETLIGRTQNRPSLRKKFGTEAISNKGNIIPLKFRTADERMAILNSGGVSTLFGSRANEYRFYDILSDDNGKTTIEKIKDCKTVVKEYINGKIKLDELTYPNIQCGESASLYGHPFFYMQNNIEDEKTKTNTKALLMLHSMPIIYNNSFKTVCEILYSHAYNEDGKIEMSEILKRVPKTSILLLGGLLWRKRYCVENNKKDCFLYDEEHLKFSYERPSDNDSTINDYEFLLGNGNKNISLNVYKKEEKKHSFNLIEYVVGYDIFSLRQSIQNVLIDFFLDWTTDNSNQGFKYFNNEFELRFKTSYGSNKELNAYAIQALFDIWEKDYRDDNGCEKINTKKTIFIDDDLTITLPYTIEDFFAEFFSDNLSKNYMKIGGSSNSRCFKFMLRESAMATNNIVKFLLDDVTIFMGAQDKRYNIIDKQDDVIKQIGVLPSELETTFKHFRKELLRLYGYDERHKERTEQGSPSNDEIETKFTKSVQIATYINFKSLYDKWLASNDFSNWELSNPDGIHSNFHFIDSFYNSISDKLMVNLEKFSNSINNVQKGNDTQSQISLYQFLYTLCADNNVQLYALPIFNNWSDKETIKKIFTPMSYYDISTKRTIGSQFLGMYYHEPSKHLNIDDEYENDGIDLADSDGKILPTALEKFKNDEGYPIPAFGVTFGMQKQSIFKNITVNMDNPQVTAPSLMATNAIANMGSPNREVVYTGQDLYRVYSNHSYTCNIEMMGCAQITPLMYFQLNNIPMFKGLYIIQNVKHRIVPGNMITNIMGVRLNKTTIPMVNDIFNINGLIEGMGDTSSRLSVGDYPYTPLVYDFHSQYIREDAVPSEYDSFETVSNLLDKNNEKLIIFEKEEKAWDMLEPHMKWLLVSIAKTVDKTCDYKVVVTSMGRLGSGSSDHDYEVDTKRVNPRRKKLGLYKSCAIDICGCSRDYKKGGNLQLKKMYSAQLFHLIATTFTECIRQLIWEDNGNGESEYRDDNVNNVIHLGSYGQGYGKINDVQQIFQSYDKEGSSIIITDSNTFEPLSQSFLSTVAYLVSDPKYGITMSNINNFIKGRDYTSDVYKNRLIEKYKLNY